MRIYQIISTESERREFIRAVEKRTIAGKRWIASFQEYRPIRSKDQNKLYRKWLKLLRDYTGHDEEELHRHFKKEFLPWVQWEYSTDSTAELKKDEFQQYLDRIQMWCFHFCGEDFQLELPEDRR